jgi:hypothetical protein
MKGDQFCTDSRRQRPHVPRDRLVAEGKMTGSKNEKRKVYAHYAAHCLHMVTVAKDQDSRAIQREMAAEWLKLADGVRNLLKRPPTRTK